MHHFYLSGKKTGILEMLRCLYSESDTVGHFVCGIMSKNKEHSKRNKPLHIFHLMFVKQVIRTFIISGSVHPQNNKDIRLTPRKHTSQRYPVYF